MSRIALILALLVGCVTRIESPPAAHPVAPVLDNQAVAFGMSWLKNVDASVSCQPRSGRGAIIASPVDTARCTGNGALAKVIVVCASPVDGKDHCDLAADWTPPAPASKPSPPPAQSDAGPPPPAPAPIARKAPSK